MAQKPTRKELGKKIEELKKEVDALITISNDRLLKIVSKDTSMREAFEMTDKVLRQSVQAIADLITIPGLINLDLADVKAVAKDAGLSLVGIGTGKGKKKSSSAAKMWLGVYLPANRPFAKGL